MLGAEGEYSPLGDEDLVGDVVGIDRQPQEGGVGDAVAQAGGGVAPSEGSQFYPPAGLAHCELVDDAWIEGPADRRERSDPQDAGIARGGLGDGGGGAVPRIEQWTS